MFEKTFSTSNERQRGFSMVELMIVVGIAGLLASVAVPKMLRMQLRTKEAEGKINLAAIRTLQESYWGEFGAYVAADPAVPTSIGPRKTPWTLLPSDSHGFNTIGFRPEGECYFQYSAVTTGTALTVAARSDIDGDLVFNVWGYVKQDQDTGVGIAGPFGVCAATGVYNVKTGTTDLIRQVGPCNASSATSEF